MKNLSTADKSKLDNIIHIGGMIAELFHPHVEVSITDLIPEKGKSKIHKIFNGQISGRTVGDETTDYDYVRDSKSLQNKYIMSEWDAPSGKRLKCCSITLENDKDEVFMAFSIQFDISMFKDMILHLEQFINFQQPELVTRKERKRFMAKQDDIQQEIIKVMWGLNLDYHNLTNKNKRQIIKKLYLGGNFNSRGIIKILSSEFALTRQTIYRWVNEIRDELGDV
jgi:predicted transcriptional regulator YheO